MAIMFFDGFENYTDRNNMMQGRWLSTGIGNLITTDDAATGKRCLRFNAIINARAYIGASSLNVSVGFHVKLASIPSTSAHRQILHRFRDAEGRDVFGIKISNTGRIMVMSAGAASSVLATGKTPVPAQAWTHIEVLVQGGQAKVYLNGRLEVEASQAVFWDPLDQVCFGLDTTGVSGGVDFLLDDVFTQAVSVEQLGILGVHYLWPNEDKLPQGWTPNTGSVAYALINEADPDDDVRYIFADGAGDKSMFGTTDLPSNVIAVLAVAPIARMRKSDMGDTSVGLGVRSGVSEDIGPDMPLHPNYVYQTTVFEVDPDTGERWSPLNMPDIFVRRNT